MKFKDAASERNAQALEEWKKNNTVTVIQPGKAHGATSHGSICAGSYGARAMSRAQGDSKWFSERKEKKIARLLQQSSKSKKKPRRGKPPTDAQKSLAFRLGIALPENSTKREAMVLISKKLNKK